MIARWLLRLGLGGMIVSLVLFVVFDAQGVEYPWWLLIGSLAALASTVAGWLTAP